MNDRVTFEDLEALKRNMETAIAHDKNYKLINDVKCDAVMTAKTYEEFRDRVAAAHLKPLEKSDKIKSGRITSNWNPISKAHNP